jgi:hypothetical protein
LSFDAYARHVDGARITLYVVGGMLELSGIVLVAAPDVFPAIRSGRRWIDSRAALVALKLRRLLRRPVSHTVSMSGTITATGTMSASGILGIDPNATLERKVELLIRHDAEAQERLNTLEQRMTDEKAARDAAIEQARGETEERLTEQMRALIDTHKRLRLIGVGLLICGAVCLNAGNFA